MKAVLIEPMPEEPAIAHAGRMALFSGCRNSRKFDQWLRGQLGLCNASPADMPRLAQLAVVAGMSSTDYARQHSMLGAIRVAARPAHMVLHGAPEGAKFTRRLGMLTQKSDSYLCTQCVEEDLSHWKFSWFRRTHQLQGVDWCHSHRTPLVKVRAADPWSLLPQHWIEKGDIEVVPRDAQRLENDGFELRFLEVACALLERSRPFDVGQLVEVLVGRARELGLRTSIDGVRSNLSDLVLRTAPVEWLERHWPELLRKEAGAFLRLDNAMDSRASPSPGATYVTVMAALWDSPLQVRQVLTRIEVPGVHPVVPAKCQRGKDPAFWQGGFWEKYLEHQGRVSTMAPEFGLDHTYLREKLNQLGLPSLHDVGAAPRWRAYLRFEAGASLQAACDAEAVSVAEVEGLIRSSCARVAFAASQVLKSQPGTSAKVMAQGANPPWRPRQMPESAP